MHSGVRAGLCAHAQWLRFMLALGVCVACAGPRAPDNAASASDEACRASCKKLDECAPGGEWQFTSCEARFCKHDIWELPRFRKDIVKRYVTCVGNQRCDVGADALASVAFGDCVRWAGESATPTKSATALCDGLASKNRACGNGDGSDFGCPQSFRFYSDAFLQKLDVCTTHACSDVGRCVFDVLGNSK
jgi:hypothetical protein